MTNYTKSTNFASKDSLASGNSLKIVKGTEIDTEFNNIAAAVATKADALSPTFTGVPLAPTAAAGTNNTQLATTAYADASSAAANYLDTTRIDVASANTINLTTSAPNTRHINITGTTQINGFTVVAGKTYFVRFNGSLTLNNSATLVTQVGRDIVTSSGDTCIIRSTAANTVEILDYSSVVPDKEIQSITATVAASALTITLNATRLDFRSPTVSSGTVYTRYVKTTASLVVPSGATLGTTNGVASKLVVIALDNAGSVELAVANTSVFLDESLLISTALLDSSSDAVDVVYSSTPRTDVAFRVVGYITSTQATAGTWASAPSLITGGSAGTILPSVAAQALGINQAWQAFTVTGGSPTRVSGTTYTNSTGKPISVSAGESGAGSSKTLQATCNGVVLFNSAALAGAALFVNFIVPPGATYSVTCSTGLTFWAELR